jgi:hypothetical protein
VERSLETTVTTAKVTGSHITTPEIPRPRITSAEMWEFTGGKVDRVTPSLQRIAATFTGATTQIRIVTAWPVCLRCFRWRVGWLTRCRRRHQPQLIIGLATIDQPLLKRLNGIGKAFGRHQFAEVTRTRRATVEFAMGAGEAFAGGKVALVLADRPIDEPINPALESDRARQPPDRGEAIEDGGNHTGTISALHGALK